MMAWHHLAHVQQTCTAYYVSPANGLLPLQIAAVVTVTVRLTQRQGCNTAPCIPSIPSNHLYTGVCPVCRCLLHADVSGGPVALQYLA